jgi:hypothetical protein
LRPAAGGLGSEPDAGTDFALGAGPSIWKVPTVAGPSPRAPCPLQAGRTRAGNLILPLAADGTLAVRATVTGGGTVHLLLDVSGYFD